MKKVTLTVEETQKTTYDITIEVKNKDLKLYEDGEIDDQELIEMYQEKVDEATANADYNLEVDDRWIEVSDYEEV